MTNQTPDFSVQNNFPIASVIDAAQRNAALQQQALQNGQQLFVQGMQALGGVGNTIVNHRIQMAQALTMAQLLKNKMDAEALPQAKVAAQQDAINQAKISAGQRTATTTPFGPVSVNQTANGATGTPVPNPDSEDIQNKYSAPTPDMIQAHLGTPDVKTIQKAVMGLSPKDLLAHLMPQQVMLGTQDASGNIVNTMMAPRGSHMSTLPRPTNALGGISFDTATPEQQALAKAMYEGNVRPSDIGFKDRGLVTMLANEYANKNGLPPFRSYAGEVNAGMAKDVTTGKIGKNVTSLNTALGHASDAFDSYQSIANTNQAWLNKPINWLKANTNDPNVVALGLNLNALQGELANVFKQSGATDQEINEWRKYLNENLTPEQVVGAMNKIDNLLRSRVSALEYQRSTAANMGQGNLLSPHAREITNRLSSPDLGSPQNGSNANAAKQPSDLVHLSTKELLDLRKKMTSAQGK